MAHTEEKNKQITSSNVDYTSKIERAKEPFKNEILKMQTKEEKLLYLKQQKQRYVLLKENSNNAYLISMVVSFILVISLIILLATTDTSVFFISFMFALIIVMGIVWIVLFMTMKNTSTNYTIILFALDDLKEKIQGSLGGGYDDVTKLKEIIIGINSEIEDTKQQVKEGYSIIEQRIKEFSKK
ncbi:hypothetical protein [Clostridium butyricum]